MDKQQLIISIIASINGSNNKPSMIREEDFIADPAGEWVKQNGGYMHIKTSLYMRMLPFSGLERFNMYTPEDVRMKLRAQQRAEREKEELVFWNEIDQLTRLRIVTTPEYRLVRYATERAEEIIRESERIFVETDPS